MRATEFAEDNFGTNPRRAARPGSRPRRGHEPIPQYRSMSETAASALQVGDPVIITGNVEYQGKTGDVREIGRDGAFVVVDLYNYGPYSFHSSDVSLNDYADSEDELNEFALDDGDDPTEDYPCYDCGSTIFLHHTKACDLAEPNAKRDLPAEPGTQYWTGEIPKGLAPIPGLAEGSYDPDAYLDPRASRDYGLAGLSWQGNSFGGGGGEPDPIKKTEPLPVGRPKKPRGTSAQLPADPFGRTTGEIPTGTPGQTFSQGTPDERLGDKKYAVETNDEKIGNMPADRFDSAMARLKQLAGAGPLKTVWDPKKRVYRNVPTAEQPKK